MIATCPTCKKDFLTEADPFITIPSSKGYALYCTCEITRLKEENKMMREGLEFYADTEKYRRPDKDRNGMGGMSSQTDFEIDDGEWKVTDSEKDHYCYGKKAREILKKIDENKQDNKQLTDTDPHGCIK